MLCPTTINQCYFPVFSSGDRTVLLNDTEHQVDFKSHQWFGATVRSHGDTILVRWPSERDGFLGGGAERDWSFSFVPHHWCSPLLWLGLSTSRDVSLWRQGECACSPLEICFPDYCPIKLLSSRFNFHLQSRHTAVKKCYLPPLWHQSWAAYCWVWW